MTKPKYPPMVCNLDNAGVHSGQTAVYGDGNQGYRSAPIEVYDEWKQICLTCPEPQCVQEIRQRSDRNG